MVRESVPKSTRDHAWHVLSAALSWAAASQLVPDQRDSLATEPRVNRRRSVRAGGMCCAAYPHTPRSSFGARMARFSVR
jgi:hypothetical protein